MSEFKFPTETVELPSKGLLYPESSPLASGKIEMKYMTAITVNINGLKVTDNHDIDWVYQNKLREQWLKDNPQAV